MELPVAVVSGGVRGPTVWINASLHGDEYLGPAAIARLLSSLDPREMSGNVILTPVVNAAAFRGMRRTHPDYDVDLNRVWGGALIPEPLAQLRDHLKAKILERSDIVLDLHSGGNRYLQGAFAVYSRVSGDVERISSGIAKACGFPFLWAEQGSMLEGALIRAAARMGKPAILLEFGGEGRAEEHWVGRMVSGLRGALAQAGVLEDDPKFLEEYRVVQGLEVVRNEAEGLWERRVDPHDDVDPGGVLGCVLGPFGEELERIRSPVGGVVLGIYTYGFVPQRELIAEVGYDIRAEPAPS